MCLQHCIHCILNCLFCPICPSTDDVFFFSLVQQFYCGLDPNTHLPLLFPKDNVLYGSNSWQLISSLSVTGFFWCLGCRKAVPNLLKFTSVHSKKVGKGVQYFYQIKRMEIFGTIHLFIRVLFWGFFSQLFSAYFVYSSDIAEVAAESKIENSRSR